MIRSLLSTLAAATGCLLAAPVEPGGEPTTVNSVHPGLASGCLTHARLADLPDGVVAKAGDLTWSVKDVEAAIANTPDSMRDDARKNAFALLEEMAIDKLLAKIGREAATKADKKTADMDDPGVIEWHLRRLTDSIQVSDEEVATFYKKNAALFGGAKLEDVKHEISRYLLEQRWQDVVRKHVAELGLQTPIVVSAAWAKEQAKLSRDNPLDHLRWKGKPTLAVFSGASCCGPDTMLPVVEEIRQKHGQDIEVAYLEARQNPVLSARYGVRAIPTTILFDKTGAEVWRQSGAQTPDALDKEIATVKGK